jgi:hypothetical protein
MRLVRTEASKVEREEERLWAVLRPPKGAEMSFKHKGTNDGPPNYDYVECDLDCPACLAAKAKKLELQVRDLQNALRDVLEISEVEGAVNLTTMESAKLMAARDLVPKESEKRNDECPKCKTRCCVEELGGGKFRCDYCREEFGPVK